MNFGDGVTRAVRNKDDGRDVRDLMHKTGVKDVTDTLAKDAE